MTRPADSREMRKTLRKAGWRKLRQSGGGGHEMWQGPQGTRINTSFRHKTLDRAATREINAAITADALLLGTGAALGLTPVGHTPPTVPTRTHVLSFAAPTKHAPALPVTLDTPMPARPWTATKYISVPARKASGRVSYSWVNCAIERAPEALWCTEEHVAVGLAAMHYEHDPIKRTRLIRRLRDGQLHFAAHANGQRAWLAVTPLHDRTPVWSGDRTAVAEWDKPRGAYRLLCGHTRKYIGPMSPDLQKRSDVLSYLETCLVPPPRDLDLKRLDNDPPPTSDEDDADTTAETALALTSYSDAELLVRLRERLQDTDATRDGTMGYLAGFQVTLVRSPVHLLERDGGLACEAGVSTPHLDRAMHPSQYAAVDCPDCIASETYATVVWALGGI